MATYTRSDVDALVTKMASERATLLDAARALSPQDADFVPANAEGEEQWSAKEQLSHLWEMECSYIAWCRSALDEDGVDLSDVRGADVPIPIEDAPHHPVAELVDALVQKRAGTVDFISGLSLADFQRTAVSPAFGELTVMQWLRSFYRHDRQHGAQIQGRQSDYQPNFTGKEPNQRQMRIEVVAARHRRE